MLKIHLFKHLRLFEDQTPLKFSAPPKAAPLWAYLLLHRHNPVPRTALAFTLWPDEPEDDARKNLRRHVYQLQRALPAATQPWLLTEHETIQWNPSAECWLDVAEFEASSNAEATWPAAVALYTGDLLETLYDDWLFYERERLRDLFFATLAQLILKSRAGGDHPAAISYAQQLLNRDPLREDTMRQLITLRYESGDRAGALKDYERFVHRLRDELGVDPMPETVAAYEAIVRGGGVTPPELATATSMGAAAARRAAGSVLPLVGREAELEQLRAWWSRATRGRGGIVLLGGEAGVGKSRLSGELRSLAEAQGGRALVGGTTFAEPAPYQALVEALRSSLPLIAALEIEPAWMAALAALLPDLAAHRAQNASPWPPLTALDPDRERQQLFEAIGRCLAGLASSRPLLIVLEDLHWAGSGTMALLEALARRITGEPILIVITYREEEAPRAHPLRDLRRRLQREHLVSHLTLSRLSAQAVTDLVARVSGLGDTAAPVAGKLFSESEGNPFFLTELIRDWIETGLIREAGQGWQLEAETLGSAGPPRGVQSIIAGRLNRLTTQAQGLAEIAAVIGPAFDVELVREAGGWNENQVLEALGELLDHQLIRETGGRSQSDYTFTHHLIQSAIYTGTPAATRARRHRRVAQIIEDLYPDRLETLSSELAGHWHQAGELAAAADCYLRAARRSLALYAADEALTYLQQALALAVDLRLRFEAIALCETIHHRRGLRPEQQADLAELERLARSLADEDLICESLRRQIIYQRTIGERQAEAALIAALTTRAEASGSARWQAEALQAEAAELIVAGQFEAARSVGERALSLRQSTGDATGQVLCYCLLIENAARQGRFDLIPVLLEKSKALAESLSDLALQAQTLRMACLVAHEHNETLPRMALAEELLGLYQTTGDREGEAYAYSYMATSAVDLFRIEEAREYFAKAEALYAALGVRVGQAGVLINSGVLAIRLGRLAEGIERCRKAEAIFEDLKEIRGQMICALNISAAAFSLGDYGLAKWAALRNLELAQSINAQELLAFAFANLGRAERELGELEQAIPHIRAGLDIRRALGETDQICTNLSDLVLTYLARSDLAAARQAADEMLDLYEACRETLREPQRPLWAAAQVFRLLNDLGRATELLAQAHAALKIKAAAVPDPESQTSFLQIPYNRQVVAAYEQGEWPALPPR